MPFSLDQWKTDLVDNLQYLKAWIKVNAQQQAPYALYGALCGLTLMPVVQAAHGGGLMAAGMALATAAGGVGNDLWAGQVERWAEQSEAPDREQVAEWVRQTLDQHADLRQALDNVLEKLDAVPQAAATLSGDDRQWFTETLQKELTQLKSSPSLVAIVTGIGNFAQNSRVVGPGGVLVEKLYGTLNVGSQGASQPSPDHARRLYLETLRTMCNVLPLEAMGGNDGDEVTLDQVYIALETTTPIPLTEEEKASRVGDLFDARGPQRRLTAWEVATQSPRLVLLGDPGGGKSTFVKQLLAQVAAAQLGEPVEVPEDVRGLLPVLVTLRDLVPRLVSIQVSEQPTAKQRAALAKAVRDQILADLAEINCEAMREPLASALSEHRCLLAFDGLDEVPYALRRRAHLAIHAAIQSFGAPRVVVTCRIRSYTGETQLSHFVAHTLAPFHNEQIESFCQAWYRAQSQLKRMTRTRAGERAADLQRAALGNDLRDLASNPMLLTTMALIHQSGIGLPNRRVELYALAVDVLLRRWQHPKLGDQWEDLDPALVTLIEDRKALRSVMERLAYEAHCVPAKKGETGDMPRARAIEVLDNMPQVGNPGLAGLFLDYVDQRAGLLLGQGGREGHPSSYRFPHRTFQEYLAGRHLVYSTDTAQELSRRVKEDDVWQLAMLLGAEELHYIYVNGDVPLLNLAVRLCPTEAPRTAPGWRAALWAGQMAALLGARHLCDDPSPGGGVAFCDRARTLLLGVVTGQDLPARERADAGNALARLGDTRPEVMTLDGMQFCHIPSGPFQMGSGDEDDMAYPDEKPPHRQEVPRAYWMARFPVTVAQFRAYVAGGGTPPEDPDSLKGQDNHPVVWVSKEEGDAFCAWLTARWQAAGWLKKGIVVRLPTEAEWEKAARGGELLPPKAPPRPVRELDTASQEDATRLNDRPPRRYPWGDDPNPDLANYDDSGIRDTSAVGCFFAGASPYGVEELSGNVFEWCATRWQDSYKSYKDDNRPGGSSYVVRGGSWLFNQRNARCACRNYDGPNSRDYNIGFRVVVASPISLGG